MQKGVHQALVDIHRVAPFCRGFFTFSFLEGGAASVIQPGPPE